MADNMGSPAGGDLDPLSKLRSDPSSAYRAAQLKDDQDATKERRIAQAMTDQAFTPMSIHEIRIHGASNTRRNFLGPLIDPLIAGKPESPSTIGEVMGMLQVTNAKLSGLQSFQPNPEIFMVSSQQTDPSTSPHDVDIDIRLRELPRFKLQTGTDVGNGEGSAYGSLLWRNIFGGAEMLSLNARTGTRTRSSYTANLSAPVLSDPNMRVSIEGVASAADKPWASHEEAVKGATARFSWLNAARDSLSVEYSGSWRQVTGLGSAASPTVRADAGDSIKSAIKSTFYRDRRDNPQLPQTGYMVRSSLEVAGLGPLGGDVAFSKAECEVGGALPLPLPGVEARSTGISVGGGLRMGLLCPLPLGFSSGTNSLPSRINDRFQLGGPTDVRGFQLCGLGPHDGQDSVGGDAFAAGSVNVLLPLPYRGPESGLRFQLFANGGRLVALRKPGGGDGGGKAMDASTVARGVAGAVENIAGGGLPSLATGFGLVYAHPVARFELNFSLPMVLRRGEVGTKGLQFGVGINFL